VERGLSKAGRVLEERIAASQAAGSVTDDLATLDAKGLRAAADAELDALAAAQQAERVASRSAAVDDVLAYRDATREANPWLVIDDPGQRRVLDKAGRSMRGALDDVNGLRENPGLLGKPLRLEEQVLEAAIAKRQAITAQLDAANVKIADDLAEELATLPGRATSVELTGKMAKRYSAFADVKVAKGGTVSVSREAAAEFADALRTGQVSGASKDALDALDGLLAQNRALQAKIKQATSPIAPRSELVSERLSSIRSAQDVLAMPKPEPGLLQKAATGGVFGAATGLAASIPLIGQIPGAAHLLGAKAADAITGLVFGRIGKATADTAARTKAAVDAFTGVAKAANKYAPPVATKVLGAVRYAAKRDDDEPEPTELPALFKRRTDEIKRLTAYDETGAPRLRPEARAEMAQLFRPVAAVDPIAADRLETIATRRIEYLSSKIPRRPDFGMSSLGPDNWQPSDMDMRAFARSVAATEDPGGVEDRASHGALSPEDVDAYWAVYPERAQDFKASILSSMSQRKEPLPYTHKLALSMLIGQPIDPSLHPRVIAVLQGQFPAEPGTGGGTQSPRPAQQFGAIRKLSDGAKTPAQERMER
jgi:hypothetical protein